MIAHSLYNYDYSTQISAAAVAAFFTYNLDLRMKTLFAGAVVGGCMTWKLTDTVSLSVGAKSGPATRPTA